MQPISAGQSGSAFGLSMVVPRDSFVWESGEYRSFEMTADSGNEKDRPFCTSCRGRICNALARTPAILNLKPRSLDG